MGPTTIKRSTVLGGITNLSVLAPVKKGMVVGFEPISYLERLRKVLDALYSARQNVRESELLQPVFPDSVGQFGIIDHFRYALVPPVPGLPLDKPQPEDGTWRLSLNVTFDGGWEPYMRVIYRDLGELLDLLFCNCDDYPGSKTSRYEDYCAWVRRNEVVGGTFYADSVMPLGDHQYLAEVEKKQRETGAAATVDKAIASYALPSEVKAKQAALGQALGGGLKTIVSALVLPLRTLTGLYRLSIYFPPGNAANHDGDRGTLRRFARQVLRGSLDMMELLDKPTTPGHDQWEEAKKTRLKPYVEQLAWLLDDPFPKSTQPPADPPYDPAQIQSHVLTNNEPVTHACVVLLRVMAPAQARASLSALATRCGPLPDGGVACVVGFTHAGLVALQVAGTRLAGFPQEFVEGMEARSSLLGDVRVNHPDRWHRPLAWGKEDSGHRVDMKAVHVLVHMRLHSPANTSSALHPRLKAEVDALDAMAGLRVLAVQPTFAVRNAQGEMAGHLNFADGISQPKIDPTRSPPPKPAPPFDQRVWPGEVLLGHANNRDDAPNPAIDPLRLDGTFLVVRKLRQHMDTLEAATSALTEAERDDLLSRMMGRQRNGLPLVPLPPGADRNDFNYDTASDACPYHSHIRRANPRDGRKYTPRIIRRGMSYGPPVCADPSAERGLVFMAYCASLSEQYETLQRWITGGNSSGVGSAQGDAFLRVPQIGEKYTFRYIDKDGKVARFVFDDKPLVRLEWGLYAFVPSLAALRQLDAWTAELPKTRKPARPAPVSPEEAEREAVRQRLDDPERAPAAWKKVREGHPKAPTHTAYGHLLGTYPEVLDAMMDTHAARYSVKGYGDRMHQSIGRNLLGLDGAEHAQQIALNVAVENIDEKTAYDLTLGVVKRLLADKDKFPDLPSPLADDAVRRPIDTLTLSDHVMADLCSHWIGLPDAQGEYMVPGGRVEGVPDKPRCPGNFASASRYIFSPQPRQGVVDAGQAQGEAVLKAVDRWLLEKGDGGLGSLAREILAGLNTSPLAPVAVTDPVFAINLAGVLLGFPPTVQGNFIRTMETWIKEETLWDCQEALFEATGGAEPSYEKANAALRKRLLGTMRKRPVPEMLWRCPVGKDGTVDTSEKNHVVLGITSALLDPAAPDALMFGRNQPDDTPGPHPANETVHGCPGYYMAMGVMLAMFAGLLHAGALRPTGSPVLLILTPKPAAAAAPTASPPGPGSEPDTSPEPPAPTAGPTAAPETLPPTAESRAAPTTDTAPAG